MVKLSAFLNLKVNRLLREVQAAGGLKVRAVAQQARPVFIIASRVSPAIRALDVVLLQSAQASFAVQ